MISLRLNVSAYQGEPPEDDGDRTIAEGPLYAPDDMVALASEEKVALWSQGAIRDAEKWSLDVSDVASLIGRALRQGT